MEVPVAADRHNGGAIARVEGERRCTGWLAEAGHQGFQVLRGQVVPKKAFDLVLDLSTGGCVRSKSIALFIKVGCLLLLGCAAPACEGSCRRVSCGAPCLTGHSANDSLGCLRHKGLDTDHVITPLGSILWASGNLATRQVEYVSGLSPRTGLQRESGSRPRWKLKSLLGRVYRVAHR